MNGEVQQISPEIIGAEEMGAARREQRLGCCSCGGLQWANKSLGRDSGERQQREDNDGDASVPAMEQHPHDSVTATYTLPDPRAQGDGGAPAHRAAPCRTRGSSLL